MHLSEKHLAPLVQQGALDRRYPDTLAHPQQAYRARQAALPTRVAARVIVRAARSNVTPLAFHEITDATVITFGCQLRSKGHDSPQGKSPGKSLAFRVLAATQLESQLESQLE